MFRLWNGRRMKWVFVLNRRVKYKKISFEIWTNAKNTKTLKKNIICSLNTNDTLHLLEATLPPQLPALFSIFGFHPSTICCTILPKAYNCHNVVTRLTIGHIQRSQFYLMRFNYYTLLRPIYNTIDVNFAIYLAGWRGWRSLFKELHNN